MDLSTELAQRCLQVKRAAIEDPNRDEFEDLASRERVARGQAARYSDIARGRAREEAEKTPAETFTGRLYPVPHTLGEAAWRLPAIAGGGALGYHAVSSSELPGQESIRKILASKGLKETTVNVPGMSQFGERLMNRLKALGHVNHEEIARNVEKGLLANPELIHAALQPNPPAGHSPAHTAARQQKAKTLAMLISATGEKQPGVANVVLSEGDLALRSLPKGKKGGTSDPVGYFRNLLEPTKGKEVKGPSVELPSEFGEALAEKLRAKGHTPEAAMSTATRIQNLLRNEPDVKALLGRLPSSKMEGSRATIQSALGGVDKSVVREALHDVASAGKYGLGEGLSKWKRYGGAAAGAGAMALATGLPLALRALWQRRQGGEAAVRAKEQMQAELSKAEEAAKQREAILARMGT
jgi:hypothetical protein